MPRFHRTLLSAALLAVLLGNLLPFFGSGNLGAQARQTIAAIEASDKAEETADLLGEKVLICTANGFKWVTWKELAEQGQVPQRHQIPQCPLCVLYAATAALTGAERIATPLYQPVMRQLGFVTLAAALPAITSTNVRHLTRAPPAFSIA